MIQEAHKKADNNFNDFVAQLYEQEFKTQEKAKYEHIKQAKEKAIEDEHRRQIEIEQLAERNRKSDEMADEQLRQENAGNNLQSKQANIQTTEPTQQTTSTTIGNDWSQVSPEQASAYMSARTGVSVSKWLDVIYKESSGNPYALNSLSCCGFLQINQSVHGNVSNLSPQEYLDKAVSIYQSSGGSAWETW